MSCADDGGAKVADVEDDGVDVERGEFVGESLAEGHDDIFRCCVGEDHGHCINSHNGANEGYFAGAAGTKVREEGLSNIYSAEGVGV